MSLETFKGSILNCDVEAIVNPANSFMRHDGGLAAVIDGCARGSFSNRLMGQDWGEDFGGKSPNWDEFSNALNVYHDFNPGLIATGNAVLGPPGALCKRFKNIIHAVGPVWNGGVYFETALLACVHNSVLGRCIENSIKSVAIPAIGAGVFGCPIDVVARVAVTQCRYTSVRVVFALTNDEHIKAYQAAGA